MKRILLLSALITLNCFANDSTPSLVYECQGPRHGMVSENPNILDTELYRLEFFGEYGRELKISRQRSWVYDGDTYFDDEYPLLDDVTLPLVSISEDEIPTFNLVRYSKPIVRLFGKEIGKRKLLDLKFTMNLETKQAEVTRWVYYKKKSTQGKPQLYRDLLSNCEEVQEY